MRYSILVIALIAFSGCKRQESHGDLPQSATIYPFGSENDRYFDFGSIMGVRGGTLEHEYKIINRSNSPIHLLRVINGNPCCGEASMEPTFVEPGKSAFLKILLRVGGLNEPLVHLAYVETDHPDFPIIEFRTTARPKPRFLIKYNNDSITRLRVGETRKINFVAHSFGNEMNVPLHLDRLTFESDLAVEWSGFATDIKVGDSIIERVRRGQVTLKADSSRLFVNSEIRIKDQNETIHVSKIRWESTPVLSAQPEALIIALNGSDYNGKLKLKSLDGVLFNVVEIKSDIPSVKSKIPEKIPAEAHEIDIEVSQRLFGSHKTGRLEIFTSHPLQPVATVVVFITNEKTKPIQVGRTSYDP